MQTRFQSPLSRYACHIILVLLTSGCTSTNASESTGTIEGTVGNSDGQWNALKAEFDGQLRSTASFTGSEERSSSFTVQGHRGNKFSILDSVSVTFSMMNGRQVEAGVLHFPENTMMPHYGDHDGSVTVTIESLEFDGDTATVKGSAKGTIYRIAGISSSPDTNDSVEVDLKFEAVAYKEEL